MRIDISFDDGHISDIRAAKLLAQYGLVGTFYYPNAQVSKTIQMTLEEAHNLAKIGMDFGGHTVNHPMDMKLLSEEELEYEIYNNHQLIERIILKRPPRKFCYPRGRHNELVREWVKKCGYEEARTTVVLNTDLPEDPYQTHTTIHMFPREEYKGRHWLEVAKEQFEIAKAKGDKGFFCLWGHTTELDRQGDWENFEEILKLIKTI